MTKLTEEQKTRFENHLNTHGFSNRCKVCGGEMSPNDRIFELGEFNGGDKVLPVITLFCNKCGNTILINTLVAGITPSDK